MWSITNVDRPLFSGRWWPTDDLVPVERNPFPGHDSPATSGRHNDGTRWCLPRPVLRLVHAWLPAGRAHRMRTRLIRAGGFPGVAPSATFLDLPTIDGSGPAGNRLTVGPGGFVTTGCRFDLGAPITLGDHVYLADRVHLLTTIDRSGRQRGRPGPAAAPISIGSGAWLGAGAVVGPGVRVGTGAIVAAGSVVRENVPANTVVAGSPAQIVRELNNS